MSIAKPGKKDGESNCSGHGLIVARFGNRNQDHHFVAKDAAVSTMGEGLVTLGALTSYTNVLRKGSTHENNANRDDSAMDRKRGIAGGAG